MRPGALPAAMFLVTLGGGCASTSPPATHDAAELPEAVIQHALETTASGEVVSWRAPATGVRGTVTPVRTYRVRQGYCRDYAVTSTAPVGQGSAWQNTACRDADGVWRPKPGA